MSILPFEHVLVPYPPIIELFIFLLTILRLAFPVSFRAIPSCVQFRTFSVCALWRLYSDSIYNFFPKNQFP
uniref:Putative secreted protein n=1 Tax=Anopheles darlingi TaxID=43151 RepID=A0A2M4D8B9_ANODA